MASAFAGLTFKIFIFPEKHSFGLDEYLLHGGKFRFQ